VQSYSHLPGIQEFKTRLVGGAHPTFDVGSRSKSPTSFYFSGKAILLAFFNF
jgi:hypothetical protein